MKRIIIAGLLVLIVGGFGAWWVYSSQAPTTVYRTTKVTRGNLKATIGATGTLEPIQTIDVGAQVNGPIIKFGDDPRKIVIGTDSKGNPIYKSIDWSSPVHPGTVLAEIDPAVYQSQVDNAKANLDQARAAQDSAAAEVDVAKANLNKSKVALLQMNAQLNQSQRDWMRAQRLHPSGAVADLDFDTSQATYLTNKSALAVGEATVAQNQAALTDSIAAVAKAKAAVVAAQAGLNQAIVNLGYCTIKSPVEGVIIDRRVNIGQTVVSSLSASSLFLLATDLRHLQAWASVNEADVGNIHSGQAVTFTVDAFPGRTFNGTVAPDQPRLNASMNQNVVTYTVAIDTDNADLGLKPYMTTNLSFVVDQRTNVLLVPNSALRWNPPAELVVPEARQDYISSQRLKQKADSGDTGAQPAAPANKEKKKPQLRKGTLWVQDGGYVRPVSVETGVTDSIKTEIVSGDIKEDDLVVTGIAPANTGRGGSTNPFVPHLFGPKKPS